MCCVLPLSRLLVIEPRAVMHKSGSELTVVTLPFELDEKEHLHGCRNKVFCPLIYTLPYTIYIIYSFFTLSGYFMFAILYAKFKNVNCIYFKHRKAVCSEVAKLIPSFAFTNNLFFTPTIELNVHPKYLH